MYICIYTYMYAFTYPWALMGQALMGRALMGRALVGLPGPLRAGPLWAGPSWAGPLWASLGPYGPGPWGPGPHGLTGPFLILFPGLAGPNYLMSHPHVYIYICIYSVMYIL